MNDDRSHDAHTGCCHEHGLCDNDFPTLSAYTTIPDEPDEETMLTSQSVLRQRSKTAFTVIWIVLLIAVGAVCAYYAP